MAPRRQHSSPAMQLLEALLLGAILAVAVLLHLRPVIRVLAAVLLLLAVTPLLAAQCLLRRLVVAVWTRLQLPDRLPRVCNKVLRALVFRARAARWAPMASLR